jgi:hypothetical protein
LQLPAAASPLAVAVLKVIRKRQAGFHPMLDFFETHPVPTATQSWKLTTNAINLCISLKAQEENLGARLDNQLSSPRANRPASR